MLFFSKIEVICLAVVYHLAARLGLKMAYVQINTSPVWPPMGIALAALLIFGYRLWPGISLGVLVGSLRMSGRMRLAFTRRWAGLLPVLFCYVAHFPPFLHDHL